MSQCKGPEVCATLSSMEIPPLERLPFEVHAELDGWTLFWADMELSGQGSEELAVLRRDVASKARERFTPESLPSSPAVKAMRLLFRAAGCDPTRYRPSSEALLRRIVRGEEIPAIHPLVDLSNTISAELAVPCCVMSEGAFDPPLVFRVGKPGEGYVSLRGPFNLERKPVLCDARGPLDCPITSNERVKVTDTTRRAWLVAYLPTETTSPDSAYGVLERQARAAPVVRIHSVGAV
jgi:DNA/RNA-binding domain of Phe-tRNA-synthetase-like protein